MQDRTRTQSKEPSAPPTKETSSSALFSGARELLIRHSGELYRLRPTAKGGLILTK
ncbi:MAG: hemin uptake protein HemP [Kiloniellales bacterium]